MTFTGRLFLSEMTLPPSAEWSLSQVEWVFARVCDGVGYFFVDSAVQPLASGDALLVGQPEGAEFRASQLGSLRIAYFCLNTDRLTGLLTLPERQRLADLAQARPRLRFFASDQALARQFGALGDLARGSNSLGLRLQLLQLFSAALAEEMAPKAAPEGARTVGARERFREMMESLAEADFWGCSVGDLADRCGCSERHFSRLFHERFSQSIRARQIDYRLKRARQLLESSETKIIDIALECGYRHLGLFNTVFKQRFGMTPSEWRRRATLKRRPARRLLATVVMASLLLAAGLACVADEPPANTPAPAPASAPAAAPASTNAPTFEVKGYAVEGNTLLTQPQLDKILNDYTGKAVTFERIRAGLTELQLAYRGRGYPTVSVTLPPQQLTNGYVKVKVIEARLVDIQVTDNRYFSSNNVMRAMPYLRTNILLNSHLLQHDLDEANASRDRQIYPTLGPGPEPGTTALTLKVKDRLPLHGKFDVDNQSTPGTPPLRMNFALQYNNLFQQEQQAGIQYNFSPEAMREGGDKLPWRFFEQPLVASYSAFYRIPLTKDNPVAPGQDSGGNFGYNEVTRQFVAPPPSGHTELLFYASRSDIDSGVKFAPPSVLTPDPFRTEIQPVGQDLTVNENVGLRLMTSLPEVAGFRQSLSAGLDFKNYRIGSFNTNFAITTITTTNNSQPQFNTTTTELDHRLSVNSVMYLPFTVRWDLNRPDKWGSTSLDLSSSVNVGGLLDGDKEFRRVTYSPKADSTYYTGTAGLTRVQRLYEDWNLLVHADGQWASGSLLSNEQFGLGGTGGVRGYRDGQEYGDSGWRVMFEPRAPDVDIGLVDTMPAHFRSSIFVDFGQRYLLENSPGRSGSLSMLGTGLSAACSIGETFDLRLAAAWALMEVPGVSVGSMRLYFTIGVQF
ncbi:MAG TPA: helix-turn-helix domain-containing protein [Verrucomicrobiae bacterium]|nr:helix-turn-helix domain-containing protein [Verrucomicrobiae bacterium]